MTEEQHTGLFFHRREEWWDSISFTESVKERVCKSSHASQQQSVIHQPRLPASSLTKDICIPRSCPTSSHGQGVQRRGGRCVMHCGKPAGTTTLERDAATTCNLHMGTYMHRRCAHVQVVLLLHPVPTCTYGCWCPVPLTFSNQHWWCAAYQELAQTLYLHLCCALCNLCWWSFSYSTSRAYCNLHCVVVVVLVVVVYRYR